MGVCETCAIRCVAGPAPWQVRSGLQPGRGASQSTSVRQSNPWNVRRARAPNEVDRRQREHRPRSRRSSTSVAAWSGRFGRDRADLRQQRETLCRRNNPRNSHPNTTRHGSPREQKVAEQDEIRWQTPCRSVRAWAGLSIRRGIPRASSQVLGARLARFTGLAVIALAPQLTEICPTIGRSIWPLSAAASTIANSPAARADGIRPEHAARHPASYGRAPGT